MKTDRLFVTDADSAIFDVVRNDPTTRTTVAAFLRAGGGGGGGGLTTEQVDDRVAALLVPGTGISLAYNDAANTLTISNSGSIQTAEDVDDRVAALLLAGTGISLSYNDVANTLTIASTVTSNSFTNSETQPSSPILGDRWYKPSTTKLYTYVNDGSSSQWVEF